MGRYTVTYIDRSLYIPVGHGIKIFMYLAMSCHLLPGTYHRVKYALDANSFSLDKKGNLTLIVI